MKRAKTIDYLVLSVLMTDLGLYEHAQLLWISILNWITPPPSFWIGIPYSANTSTPSTSTTVICLQSTPLPRKEARWSSFPALGKDSSRNGHHTYHYCFEVLFLGILTGDSLPLSPLSAQHVCPVESWNRFLECLYLYYNRIKTDLYLPQVVYRPSFQ